MPPVRLTRPPSSFAGEDFRRARISSRVIDSHLAGRGFDSKVGAAPVRERIADKVRIMTDFIVSEVN